MHHFIYPNSDTYITNAPEFVLSNLGGDESLVVGTKTRYVQTHTLSAHINIVGAYALLNFNGIIDGFLCGDADYISGSIYQCDFCYFMVFTDTITDASSSVYYTASITASYGAVPYTYSIISGSLPTGLILDNYTGSISGIPTGSGLYSFIINVKDANLCFSSMIYTIYVEPETPWILI